MYSEKSFQCNSQGRKTTKWTHTCIRESIVGPSGEKKNASFLSFKHSLDSSRKRLSGEMVRPQKFVSRILCCVASVDNSFYFFRTTVLRKLFDIRFSYKRCYFSPGCLLVKMASKPWQGLFSTVTRSSAVLKMVFFLFNRNLVRIAGEMV